MQKILVINGHPDPESFNHAISNTYVEAAKGVGAEVKHLIISKLSFEPNLQYGYRKRMELEPDLLNSIEDIRWADHIVWVHPLWWLGLPAKLKGFIDRSFLPGITYGVDENMVPFGLLDGRTSHIICTSDMPDFIYESEYSKACFVQMEKGILEPCGVRLTGTTFIGPMANSEDIWRKDWLLKITELAKEQAGK